MLSAQQLKFSSREGGTLPAWIANPPRPLCLWSLSDAKTVALRSENANVYVKVRELSSLFVGEIVGFEPKGTVMPHDVRVGELIIFNKTHIFEATD
jgi:hypothetical protein